MTSVVMKAAERIILKVIKSFTAPFSDPLQFAYSAKRSTEDALLFSLEKLYSHLERSKSGNMARILYFDFSSAFNTLQPSILGKKLLNNNVPSDCILWVLDYLIQRSQFVYLRSSGTRSSIIYTNTGAPQGTVLAPYLFTLYTSDIRSANNDCVLVKFADDTALIGLICNDDSAVYLNQVNTFVDYCKDNYLVLNVSKTKELILDYRINKHDPNPVIIDGSEVQRTDHYKYLGVVMDNKLCWKQHVDYICKKLNSRLYCLRKLNKFQISSNILQLFYDSVVSSVWKYCVSVWGGNSSKKDMDRITSTIRKASKLLENPQETFIDNYEKVVIRKMQSIRKDDSHPLFLIFENLVNARSGRMRLPYASTNRHRLSFVPQGVKFHNRDFSW